MREIHEMSLQEKIGQMILCGFEGIEPSESLEALIVEQRIGGVIYFARNVVNTKQVAGLSGSLQAIAERNGTLPLWISIDQEGGMVARITEGVALMPGSMALAAGDAGPEGAYEAAFISGKELRSLGINLNFAPDLDVNNNPDNPVIGVRSFGESPEQVALYGRQAVRGFQEANVVATAKHFPGHGDTNTDSHLDLPTITHDEERIRAVELVPFVEAIQSGVDAIMSSHIYFPALEPNKLPVTLSKAVLTGLLREELGYEGIIMTDCMEMNAISEHYGTVAAAVMAVEAGADLVLISHSRDRQIGAMAAIEQAVREGRIAEAQIDASVRRLLALKARRGVLAEQPRATAALEVGTAAHRAVAERLSEASITLVKDEQQLLPLRRVRTLAVTVAAAVSSGVDEAYAGVASLGTALAEYGLDVIDRVLPLAEVSELRAAVLADALAAEQIVIGTYNARFHPAQVELVRELQALGKPLVVVALRVPYDLLEFPDVSTFIAAYESRPLALNSTARSLLGMLTPQGRLPVTLGTDYPAGWRWENGGFRMKYVPLSVDWLTELSLLWNRELGDQFPMQEQLLRQNSFSDVNVLQGGSWIAVDEISGKIVGFIVAKLWQEHREFVLGAGAGWIQVLLVDRDYRRLGIGSELLKRAETALLEHGVHKILIGRDPWHYFPGVPKEYPKVRTWLESKGYKDDNRVENDLLAIYDQSSASKLPIQEGVSYRLLEIHEKNELLAFLRRCFPGRWEYEAIRYFELGGTGREFVVIETDGHMIGFCRINDSSSPIIAQNVYWSPLFEDELGGIGPLGVDSAYQGKGYGLAVVQAGVHFLRERGIRKIVIDWTTLVAFYEKLNYRVWKSYDSFSKVVETKEMNRLASNTSE
jgi:beta-N-acetylhexosaminidase